MLNQNQPQAHQSFLSPVNQNQIISTGHQYDYHNGVTYVQQAKLKKRRQRRNEKIAQSLVVKEAVKIKD